MFATSNIVGSCSLLVLSALLLNSLSKLDLDRVRNVTARGHLYRLIVEDK